MNGLLQQSALKHISKTTAPLPFVSIIMPVYNEAAFIEKALHGVLDQDYPSDKLEIIVADGLSTDGTRKIIAALQTEHPNLRLIDNPRRIVPTGLNQAIASARGEIVVRLDGHCEYPKNYVTRVVTLQRETKADNVGGVLVPAGTSYVQKAVAAAYYSRIGFGGYALKGAKNDQGIREVDTVHGGCWERKRLLDVGGFDEEMVRNQDDELSFRLRKNNGRIFQSLDLRVRYHVRNSFKKVFLQFAQYGFWKVQVIRRHPKQASVRHFMPALFVLSLLTSIAAAPFSAAAFVFMQLFIFSYLSVLSASSIMQTWADQKLLWSGILFALVLMHVGYGLGFLVGLIRCATGWTGGNVFKQTTR